MNQIYSKITTEHIGKIIDYTAEEDRREAEEEKEIRSYERLYFLVTLGALIFFVIFLVLMQQLAVLAALMTGLLGFGGGYGLGISRRSWPSSKN